MKKIRRFLPLLLIFCLLSSCRRVPPEEEGEAPPTINEETLPNTSPADEAPESTALYDYPARILRGGSRYDQEDERTEILSTADELHDYLRDLLGVDDLAAWSAPFSSMTIVDMTADYDKTFFATHSLAVSYLVEGSGSFRHEYFGVTENGQILLRRIVPEVFTDDMAAWNVFVEIPKDSPLLAQAKPLSALVTSESAVWNKLLGTPPDDPAYSASLPLLELTDSDGRPAYFPADGKAPSFALFSRDFGFLDLLLPHGWQHEEIDDGNAFGIRFYPEDDPSASVDLFCHREFPGLCGTMLTAEDVTLSNGRTAILYTEDLGESLWRMYFFTNTPGEYTAEYTVSKKDADRFDAAVRSILEHSQIAESGLIDSNGILAIAQNDLPTGARDSAAARFDVTKGIWTVHYPLSGSERGVLYYDYLGRKMDKSK